MTEPGLEKFGKFVEYHRCNKRWSQNQLGKLIGVSSSYVTSLEEGALWPDDHVVDEIASLFGIPHEYLYAMMGKKPQHAVSSQFGARN